jgi:hypothetical protein
LVAAEVTDKVLEEVAEVVAVVVTVELEYLAVQEHLVKEIMVVRVETTIRVGKVVVVAVEVR